MNDLELKEEMKKRFAQLPKVVQSAITSADVQKHLRELADTHKLHIDQWQLLENNVMLTLLGFQPIQELAQNVKSDLNIREEQAQEMAGDISKTVFEPIRQEMERELQHPQAKEEEKSDMDKMREKVLSKASSPPPSTEKTAPRAAAVEPATPPPAPPEGKADRAATSNKPASGAYKPGERSTERKVVDDDPYREPPA